MKSLSWQAVRRRRLARNYLIKPAPASQIAAVVAAVCGVQAQVLSAAELALGARLRGSTLAAVRAALWEQRSLVKTYGPRGTLHLLPAAELPLWMAAMRAHDALQEAQWFETAGLKPRQAAALLAAIGAALDGRCLTRAELAAEVARRVGAWAKEKLLSAWGEMLRPAALAGAVCFGPSQGSQVTFVRADQWIGACAPGGWSCASSHLSSWARASTPSWKPKPPASERFSMCRSR